MKKVVLLIFTIIALLLSACEQVQVDSAAETPTTLPSAKTATPLENIEPTIKHVPPTPKETGPTPPPTETPIPVTPTPDLYKDYPTVIQLGDPLPDDHPWLLVELDRDLYLISENGEHLIKIDPSNLFSDRAFLHFKPSPKGNMVAVFAANDLEGVDKNLYLWSLVDNTITHISSLLGNQDSSEMTADEYSDIYHSAGRTAWSHDSNKLAFTSAHLGSTTDLYVYDVATGEILWLTSGPTQAINPVWSPDDAYILHTGVTQMYIGYSGSGYSGWQYFSASPDGRRVHSLPVGKVKARGFEEYLGWVSDRQMLVHSGYDFCGWFGLRMMNIGSGEEYYIWHGNYNSIAYSPEAGLALIYISPIGHIAEEFCGLHEREPGLYLVTIPDGQVTEVPLDGIEGEFFDVEIINGDLPFYLVERDQRYTVDVEGNIQEFKGNPNLPEQFQKYSSRIDQIYGWISSAGLEINE